MCRPRSLLRIGDQLSAVSDLSGKVVEEATRVVVAQPEQEQLGVPDPEQADGVGQTWALDLGVAEHELKVDAVAADVLADNLAHLVQPGGDLRVERQRGSFRRGSRR